MVTLEGATQNICISCVELPSSPVITNSGGNARDRSDKRLLIHRIAEECNALFESAFPARNSGDKPFRQYICCQHCLQQGEHLIVLFVSFV